MTQTYQIKEYQSFTRNRQVDVEGFKPLPEKTFDSLENFVLKNMDEKEEASEAWEYLSLSVKYGVRTISARNYVGIITMSDGITIEILPKIDQTSVEETKKIFLEMLKTVKDIPYKASTVSSVDIEKMTLYEIFIKMFLREVTVLVKRGLKFGYVQHEGNESFLKGRLDFNQQIRLNMTHQERFYVAFDVFEANRPENRLIKSALLYVWKRSHDSGNRRACRRLLAMMDDIQESQDYISDFSQYTANRNMKEYDTVMKWCKVFLMNKSFTVFHGEEVAFALLFPMEKLFESYVADRIQKHMDRVTYRVRTQDSRYHLFDAPKKFSLRPDIVVSNQDTGRRVVLDTKWKALSPSYNNYGISQSDMYQMYAYHKKYHPGKVLLVYPYNQAFDSNEKVISYTAEDKEVHVQVMFFDLKDVTGSLCRIEEAMGI